MKYLILLFCFVSICFSQAPLRNINLKGVDFELYKTGISESNKFSRPSSPPFKFKKVVRDFLMGTAFGNAVGLIFGALTYWGSFDTHGHGTVTKTDAGNTGLVGFVLGHAVGSTGGVFVGGNDGSSRGSIPLAILGGIMGEAGGLALHLAWKNIGTVIPYLFLSPFLAALGHNLIQTWKDE